MQQIIIIKKNPIQKPLVNKKITCVSNKQTKKLPLWTRIYPRLISINMTKIFYWNLNGANTKEVVVDLPGLVSDGIDEQYCGTCLRGKLCLETTSLQQQKRGFMSYIIENHFKHILILRYIPWPCNQNNGTSGRICFGCIQQPMPSGCYLIMHLPFVTVDI